MTNFKQLHINNFGMESRSNDRFEIMPGNKMKLQAIHNYLMILNNRIECGYAFGNGRLIYLVGKPMDWWLKKHQLNPAIVPGFFVLIGFVKMVQDTTLSWWRQEFDSPTRYQGFFPCPSIDGWLGEGQNGCLLSLESGWRPQAGLRLSCDVMEKLQCK